MSIDATTLDLAALGLRRPEDTLPEKKELGQEDFLKLMITQFRNQDPFKPMENGEFLAQLAQFSTVKGLDDLNSSFGELSSSVVSNQALQASSLLGRDVLVTGSTGHLQAGSTLSGAVELTGSAGEVIVQITDSNGVLARQINLGPQPAGLARFTWDGRLADGNAAPQGLYTVKATTLGAGSVQAAAQTLVDARVESVTMSAGQRGLSLTLRGIGEVAFGDVRSIR
jgi:flagellar basal-body rod modification protein FlgD